MRGNRSRDTRPEIALRSALHRSGLRFRKHQQPLPGTRLEVDIVFPTERVAVWMDGCIWHGCSDHGMRPDRNAEYWASKIARNVARDRRNDTLLEEAGWLVIRIWEHEEPVEAASRVNGIVAARRAMAAS
jgi:DNA mismatch endonuclease (patch repair protein)